MIFVLPFVFREHSRRILKTHYRKKAVLHIKVEAFFHELEFTITVWKTAKFGWRSMKANLLVIIKYYMVPTFVNSVCWVQMKVSYGLQARVNFVTSAVHQDGWNWRVMTYLLGIDWVSGYVALIGFTQNRIKRLFNI